MAQKISAAVNVHYTIKPLYYLSRFFSLWPYRYEYYNKIVDLTFADKIRAYSLMAAIIINFTWIIYATMKYNLQEEIGAAINVAFIVCEHAFTILSILLANSSFGNLTKRFFTQLEAISKNLIMYKNIVFDDLYKKFQLQLKIIYTFGSLLIAFDIGLHIISVDYVVVLQQMSTYVVQNLLLIIYLQILCKLDFLECFFKEYNERFSHSTVSMNQNTISVGNRIVQPKHIRELCKIHRQLCNLIQNVNDAHGWQIVILFCAVGALSLHSLFYIIEGVTELAAAPRQIVDVEKALLCKEIIDVLFRCGLFVILSTKCSSITKQALRTGVIANDILLDMEVENPNKYQEIYKEQLQRLVQHISYRSLDFSAADMFVVNHSTISLLAGVVTTYFIVCLQFRHPVVSINAANYTNVDHLNLL